MISENISEKCRDLGKSMENNQADGYDVISPRVLATFIEFILLFAE